MAKYTIEILPHTGWQFEPIGMPEELFDALNDVMIEFFSKVRGPQANFGYELSYEGDYGSRSTIRLPVGRREELIKKAMEEANVS